MIWYYNQGDLMKKLCHFFLIVSILCSGSMWADSVVWSGEVNSDGTPTVNIPLTLGKKYQIRVSGEMNLGKWWQQGKPLAEDACYEYNDLVQPIKLDTLKNSMNIPLDNTAYHPNHVYQSKPFVTAQSGIHFWIYDTDYNNNSGSLHAEVLEISE